MGTLNNKLVDYQSLKENTKLILNEALAYDKGLTGGYNGDFPLTAATKDNIYRVPATNKFYVCIENYNGSNLTAPNANFVELSVWKNYDRLSNLIKIFQKNDWLVKEYNNNYVEAYSTLTASGIERTIDLPVTIDTSKPFAAFANVIYINSHETPSAAEVQINSGKQLIVFNSPNKSVVSGAYVFVKIHGFIA